MGPRSVLSRLWTVFSIVVGLAIIPLIVVTVAMAVSLCVWLCRTAHEFLARGPFDLQLGYDDFLWVFGLLYVLIWFGRGLWKKGRAAFLAGMAFAMFVAFGLSAWREYTFSSFAWKLAGIAATDDRRQRMEPSLRRLFVERRIATKEDVRRYLGAPDQEEPEWDEWEYSMGHYRKSYAPVRDRWLCVSFDDGGMVRSFEFDSE